MQEWTPAGVLMNFESRSGAGVVFFFTKSRSGAGVIFEHFLRGLYHSISSLNRSRSAKLTNVLELVRSRSIFTESRSGVGIKNFNLRTPLP